MKVFKKIQTIEIQGQNAFYVTWTDAMTQYLDDFGKAIHSLPDPLDLTYEQDYQKTFSFPFFKWCWVNPTVENILNELYSLQCQKEIFILKNMINEKISHQTLHYFFITLQMADCYLRKNYTSSLYAPLGETSDHGFEFAPHFDLYPQKHLLIIYNNVSPNHEGMTTFMALDKLKRIMKLNPKIFPDQERILNLLTMDLTTDRFTQIFNTFYAKDTADVKKVLFDNSVKFKLTKGDGFLINDRYWLHGRTKLDYSVKTDRLIRFVFN